MSDDLHLKYRPQKLSQLVGQEHIIKSLSYVFEKGKNIPHAYLLTGKSGTGKTTVARIIGNHLNCKIWNILQVDAGVYSGVDDMRKLLENLQYETMGENPVKFIILEEAHSLSKQSFNSLLLTLEDPPEHVYFVLCTTEPNKIPEAIQSRCQQYHFKDVRIDDLLDLLEYVCIEEKIELSDECLRLIAKESYDSPRFALIYLSKSRGCETVSEIASLLETVENEHEIIELCRLLINNNPSWEKAVKIFKKYKDKDGESIRIQIVRYLTTCILGSKTIEQANYYLSILELFSTPIYKGTGIAEILLSVGAVCSKK